MANYYTDGQGGLSTILKLFGVGKLRPDDPETGNLYKEGFGDRITGGRAEALNLQHQMAARERQNQIAQEANRLELGMQYLPRELDIRTGDAVRRETDMQRLGLQNLPNELDIRTADALKRYGGTLDLNLSKLPQELDARTADAIKRHGGIADVNLQYLPRELSARSSDAVSRYADIANMDLQNLPKELSMRTSDALTRYGGQLRTDLDYAPAQSVANASAYLDMANAKAEEEEARLDREEKRKMERAYKGAQEFGFPNIYAQDAAEAAAGQTAYAEQQRAFDLLKRREAALSDAQRNDIAMQQLQIEEAGRRQALAQALAPVIQNIGSGGSIISDPYKGLTTVSPSGMEEYIPQSIDATTGRVVQSLMAEPLRRMVGPRFGGRMEDSSQGPRAIIPPGMTPGATNAPAPAPSTGAPAPASTLDNNTLRALLQRIQQLQEQRQLERLPFTAF